MFEMNIRKYNFIFVLLVLLNFHLLHSQNQSVIQSVLKKVVMIIPLDDNYQPLGIGSGFIISNDGQIATNYHVVEGATSAIVKFVDSEEKYTANYVYHKNPYYDIAVIKIDKKTTPLSLGDDELIQIGEKILAVGNPEGLEGTVSEGIVSGFRKLDEGFRLMQITSPISPGSSGGPVINSKGDVLGIASLSIVTGQNLNFAVPVKYLKELLQERIEYSEFGKSILPVSIKLSGLTSIDHKDLIEVTKTKIETRYQGGGATVSLSIRNNYSRDIKNIRILIIWNEADEMVHFSPILITEIIPSKLTKSVQKHNLPRVGDLSYKVNSEIRIMDYEIQQTSGFIEFK